MDSLFRGGRKMQEPWAEQVSERGIAWRVSHTSAWDPHPRDLGMPEGLRFQGFPGHADAAGPRRTRFPRVFIGTL